MGDLVAFEDDLRAVASSLSSAGSRALSVANQRRLLANLMDSSPSIAVRLATEEFLETWELVVWDVGDELTSLGRDARRSADAFEDAERQVYGSAPRWLPPVPVWAAR